MPDTPALLQKYYDQLKLLRAFNVAEGILSWDRETFLPPEASADRGETFAVLSGFIHQEFTKPEFVQLVNELFAAKDELKPLDRRSVILTHRELAKSVLLPQAFVEETQTVLNTANAVWVEAKKTNNFALFAPHLEKVIANRRQYAKYIDPQRPAYDVLLDDYEEGLTQKFLDPLFAELKTGLHDLLPKALAKQAKQGETPNPLDHAQLDRATLEKFLRDLAGQIGFDWQRGVLGHVEHPFETSISPNDIRINTHFEEAHHSFTVTGLIHELGHGLYEQNIDPKYRVSPFLSHGVSFGIHESQSRLLENWIGRSNAFWQFAWPKFQTAFADLRAVPIEKVMASMNTVERSLIRTEADEITYNLHILLRYEIETALINGELAVADVPKVWRQKMTELIGIAPETDRDGALQDVHWSWGNIGYFPTYTLGNLNAAQLWQKFVSVHPGWAAEIAAGNFTSYFTWFKENVWQHGSFYEPEEVMKRATGEVTNAKYLLKYLQEKFG